MVTDRADPTKATESFFLLMYVRGGDRVVMECSYVVMHPISAFISDKVINLVCGVFIFAVHAISRVTIYGCVVYAYIYYFR